VEGTNPTLASSLTYENSPANLNVTTSWARYTITVAVDTASTKNIIVFIWSDVTDTTLGDFLYVTDVQLEYGSVPTRFTMHGGGFEGELAACQRYYWQISNGGSGDGYFGSGFNPSTTRADIVLPLTVTMRVAPTSLTFSNLRYVDYAYNATNISNVRIGVATNSSILVNADGTGFTLGRTGFYSFQTAVDAYFGVNAEL
jgi:hypothetical protein